MSLAYWLARRRRCPAIHTMHFGDGEYFAEARCRQRVLHAGKHRGAFGLEWW